MRRRIAVCVTAAVAGIALTACVGDDAKSKLDSISETINDANKLDDELYQAVNRLIVDCMAEQGFDVHPGWLTNTSDGQGDSNPLDDTHTPDAQDVPTLKDAKKEGFGRNTGMDPDEGEAPDEEDGSEAEDPFYAESEKYQEEYQRAQFGDEYYELMFGDPMEAGGEPGDMTQPLEGGCAGEVGEKVYGEPIMPDPEDEHSVGMGPYFGVEIPAGLQDWEHQEELYQTEELLDTRDDLSKCIEAEGYPYFEYSKQWGMGMSGYADGFYAENAGMFSDDADLPAAKYDLPKGAPWKDHDEAFDAEVAFATTVAKCADDTGFRKVSKDAWRDAVEKSVLDSEKEIYAWYEDIKAALDRAQDLIGE